MSRNIFLTFDMDWAIDGVLEDFLSIIENNRLKGTLNVTNRTEVLGKKNDNLELGIHPNYNRLLMGDNIEESYINILENIVITIFCVNGWLA